MFKFSKSNDESFRGTDNYRANENLAAIVNLAIDRQRPLLITGEAGTGKTQLAYAVAQYLNTDVHRAQMTSTMEGEEVCYTFDSVLRLTDSQIPESNGSRGGRDVADPMCYVRYGALGRAFIDNKRSVALLDEIDKTESDVQDNLLRVLESYEFEVREANHLVRANHRPVIVITSNGKRELSDAFLRRVYAHHVEFPTPEELGEIAMMHYPSLDKKTRDHAINILAELRSSGLEKPPATGELLEWLGALSLRGITPPNSIYDGSRIPFPGVLLKRGVDLEQFVKGTIGARRQRSERVR